MGSYGAENDTSKQKIDLSNVSYLKPYIMNPETYQLAHKGVSRTQRHKTDAVKSLE